MSGSSRHSVQQDVETVREGLGGDFSFAGIGPSEEKFRNATAALDRLEEQLEALRRHDEAATQDAVTFRKRMVQLEEAIRHELGVTHGDDTIRRLRAAIDAPYPASELVNPPVTHGRLEGGRSAVDLPNSEKIGA